MIRVCWHHRRWLILVGIVHWMVGCQSPHPPTYRVCGQVQFADGAHPDNRWCCPVRITAN